MNRRGFLQLVGTTSAVGVAGCGGDEGGNTTTAPTQTTTADVAGAVETAVQTTALSTSTTTTSTTTTEQPLEVTDAGPTGEVFDGELGVEPTQVVTE